MTDQDQKDAALAKAVAECAGWDYEIDEEGWVCVSGVPAIEEMHALDVHRFDHVRAACEAANVDFELFYHREQAEPFFVVVFEEDGYGQRRSPADPAKALALALCEACGVEVTDD